MLNKFHRPNSAFANRLTIVFGIHISYEVYTDIIGIIRNENIDIRTILETYFSIFAINFFSSKCFSTQWIDVYRIENVVIFQDFLLTLM